MQPYARRLAFAFLHKELTDNLPRKFKVAFAGCPEDCIATAINDVGLRAVIRDGVRGFRMTVAGGLGPLPTEAKLLHDFIPAEDVVSRVEAVIRISIATGIAGTRTRRGSSSSCASADSTGCATRSKNNIRTSCCTAESRCRRKSRKVSVVFSRIHHRKARATCCRCSSANPRNCAHWRETNVRPQKQAGYSIVTVTVPQGNLTGEQMRGLGRSVRAGGRRLAAVLHESERGARVGAGGRGSSGSMARWLGLGWLTRARTRSAT